MIGESGEIQEEDVKLVQKWIELNHGKILALWNDEIDVFQANFTRVRYSYRAQLIQNYACCDTCTCLLHNPSAGIQKYSVKAASTYQHASEIGCYCIQV